MHTAANVLQNIFGYTSFREGQRELIDAIMQKRDVCGIMPTGAGKSLCYQVPAMLLPGVTLVISPLISLMRDQVMGLVAAGVPAAFINSSLTEAQCAKAMSNARTGLYKIIYIAPERLLTPSMTFLAAELDISLVAVDEAHCISQWGQDFRPNYMDIPAFIAGLRNRPVLGAFTATATPRVRSDIVRALALQNPLTVVTGFDRPNLYFAVRRPKDKYKMLTAYLHNNNSTGIVYCSTRKETDKLTERLTADGYSAAAYHAGLPDTARTRAQDDFLHDRTQIIVATNAFGMGIDKSNVRFVIHYNLPQNIEAYYQEAGRAGRDGLPADCILFYAKQDIFTSVFLIKQSENEEEIQRKRRLLNRMVQYCEAKTCLRNYLLTYFGEKKSNDCGDCGNCNTQGDSIPDAADSITDTSKRPVGKSRARVSTPASTSATSDPLSNPLSIPAITDSLSTSVSTPAITYAFYNQLFDKLKSIRLEIAKREKVPAFVIFSDATLVDMCQKHPLTPEELLKVSGVGNVKLERYGEPFLEILRSTPRQNDTQNQPQPTAPALTKEIFLQEILFEDESIQITRAADNINAVLLKHHMKKTSGITLNKLLLANGYLEDSSGVKLPTSEGTSAGITTIRRSSSRGDYDQCLFNKNAQRLCAMLCFYSIVDITPIKFPNL